MADVFARLTTAEVRLLQAWRECVAANPWQQPTVSELASLLGRAPSSVHEVLHRLARRGLVVRSRPKGEPGGRCWSLTPEAAARPQVGALARLAKDVVTLRPGAFDDADPAVRAAAAEEYARLWSRARGIIAEVVALASLRQEQSEANCAADE